MTQKAEDLFSTNFHVGRFGSKGFYISVSEPLKTKFGEVDLTKNIALSSKVIGSLISQLSILEDEIKKAP